MRLRISPLLDPALRQSQLGQDGSEPQGASAQIWTACRWDLPPPAIPRFPLVVAIELPTNRNRGPHCQALDLLDCLSSTWLRLLLVPKSSGFSLGTCFSSQCLTGDVTRERESGGKSKRSHLVPFTSWQPGWQRGRGGKKGEGSEGEATEEARPPKAPQEAGSTRRTQSQGMWAGQRECWWRGRLDGAPWLRWQGSDSEGGAGYQACLSVKGPRGKGTLSCRQTQLQGTEKPTGASSIWKMQRTIFQSKTSELNAAQI